MLWLDTDIKKHAVVRYGYQDACYDGTDKGTHNVVRYGYKDAYYGEIWT